MASTTTLLTLKTILEDNKFTGIKQDDERAYVRACIGGLEMLSEVRKWSFHRSDVLIQTVAPESVTLANTVVAGETTVTATNTPFAAGDEGKYLEFAGQQQLYEIESVTNSNEVELRYPYQGVTIATTDTVTMMTRDYALPQQFNTLLALIAENGITTPSFVEFDDLLYKASNDSGASMPTVFAIDPENTPNNTSNVKYISLDPPPGDVYQYTLYYHRIPGWYDGTTGAWKAIPTDDTDIVDWPDEKVGVLHKAILKSLAEENDVSDRFFQKAQMSYFQKLELAIGQDEEQALRGRIGQRPINSRINGTLDYITGRIEAQ